MPKRRDQVRMTPAEVDAFLHGRHTMNIATINHDGTIHLVAMWYGFVDGDPVFETYARSQKVLNLRRDPRLTALVEDGDAYENLRGVELVGTGEVIESRDVIQAAAEDVVHRYLDLPDGTDVADIAAAMSAKRVAIRVRAEKVVSWDHRKLPTG
ncbi:MAG: TIGR03618 family F420-dependent PPOX class oxidoreductase [Actinobacteria bacterium]|nr:TIGR03618 family F420-dependent PPOX class oxidoreductase [Actinomycetota bacterium]